MAAPPPRARRAPAGTRFQEARGPSRGQPTFVRAIASALGPEGPERYEEDDLLGKGGMGEVMLARDRRMGRHIALKHLGPELAEFPRATQRFLREASIQGQLEHPAIVPVYDIGLTRDGQPFFTMRRLRGETLDEILEGLRSGNATYEKDYPRHRLLTAFVTVCQAVEFAHSRGVIHRDLKPSNIMMGAFGEVYVLDWGIAKLVSGEESEGEGDRDDEVSLDLEHGPITDTHAGTILGTYGYMSPEQQRPDLGPHSHRSDVYALGAILYEIASGHPLHFTSSSDTDPMADTAPSPPPGDPTADAPPELQRLWFQALRTLPTERTISVRELREGVEVYLRGDRDLATRKERSTQHAEAASLASMRLHAPGPEGHAARKVALRELSQALLMDPQNHLAAEQLEALLTRPPASVPQEVRTLRVDREDKRVRLAFRQSARLLAWGMVFTGVPIFTYNLRGLTARPFEFVVLSVACFASIFSFKIVANSRTPLGWQGLLPLVPINLAILSISWIGSPIAPLPVVGALIAMGLYIDVRRTRPFHAVLACLTIGINLVGGFVLQHFGILERQAEWRSPEEVVIHARMLWFDSAIGPFALAAVLAVCLVFANWRAWQVQQELLRTQEDLDIQSWQLRQLAPSMIAESPPSAGSPKASTQPTSNAAEVSPTQDQKA